MDEDYEVLAHMRKRRRLLACCAGLIVNNELQINTRKKRKVGTHSNLLRRDEQSVHHNLFLELALEEPNRFRRCLRMDTVTFEELLHKVHPLIAKKDTVLRASIPAAQRLSLTLRHLATGESQELLRLSFRIGQSTISGIIRDVCRAIHEVLHEEYLPTPSSSEQWEVVANQYGYRWNFYNCIGAIDGKHIRIDPPVSSGSSYHNNKGFSSIVLLALVDADLRFIYIDVGTNGRVSDSGIWNRCSLKAHLERGSLKIPQPKRLPDSDEDFPFVILGDEIFPLTENMLIPFSKAHLQYRDDRRIFNYRLSRARRCSENAFGVMGARFQIFRSPMRYDPDIATEIVQACCCIHNMLRSKAVGAGMYTPHQFLDREDFESQEGLPGDWREEPAQGVEGFAHQGGNRHRRDAMELRDRWCEYFNNQGAVPWQARMAGIRDREQEM